MQAKKLKIEQLKNKLQQLKNKLEGETAELQANENETKLLKDQYDRQLKMFEQGLVSQTQLQQKIEVYCLHQKCQMEKNNLNESLY